MNDETRAAKMVEGVVNKRLTASPIERQLTKEARPRHGAPLLRKRRRMPKKKEPELMPDEQFKRFQEAAKEHEVEKRLPKIERAFEKLSAHKKQQKD